MTGMGIVALDCGIFWLLTYVTFNKMQIPPSTGFPVVLAGSAESMKGANPGH